MSKNQEWCWVVLGALMLLSWSNMSNYAHALPSDPSTTDYKQKLRFREDGSFTIVVFTDLHYGEGESLDAQNDALQKTVLDAETPDLVVYLGDIVSGWKGSGKRGWMKGMLERALKYSNDAGYLHALLLGNHDDEADLTREEILLQDIESSNSMGKILSLTEMGPLDITGASNYYLDVLSTNNNMDWVDARLWFFDSMNRGCEDDSNSWGCVGVSTVEWMKNTSQSIPQAMQSIGFVHIPVPEHRLGYGDFRATGIRQEDSACPTVNTGLAKELVMQNVSMVVSGHDHQNDFVGNVYISGKEISKAREKNDANTTTMFYPGSGARQYGDVPLLMAYGRKSGYGSYGPGNIARGARVIRLETVMTPFDEDVLKESRSSLPWYQYYSYWSLTPQMMHDGPFYKMQTWVRNEFGSKEDEVRPGFKYEVQPECYNGSEGKSLILVLITVAWFF
jgi:hypothetical protein